MSVIINELEVATTPEPPPSAAPNSPTQSPSAAGPPTPFELRAIIAHLARRTDRVRAD